LASSSREDHAAEETGASSRYRLFIVALSNVPKLGGGCPAKSG
jgi:hypothetical protein